MLVVTRRKGEKILIPELGVEITIVDLEPGRARVGVKAPDTVVVLREELLKNRVVKR